MSTHFNIRRRTTCDASSGLMQPQYRCMRRLNVGNTDKDRLSTPFSWVGQPFHYSCGRMWCLICHTLADKARGLVFRTKVLSKGTQHMQFAWTRNQRAASTNVWFESAKQHCLENPMNVMNPDIRTCRKNRISSVFTVLLSKLLERPVVATSTLFSTRELVNLSLFAS